MVEDSKVPGSTPGATDFLTNGFVQVTKVKFSVQRYSIVVTTLELWIRRSLVQVPSGCQYSMRLDRLHL